MILETGRGQHREYGPYAFTEQGVAMLSSVLRSPRAVQLNREILRVFVRLRRMLRANAELVKKLAAVESRYDAQFRVVRDAIRNLMAPPLKPGNPIPGRPPQMQNVGAVEGSDHPAFVAHLIGQVVLIVLADPDHPPERAEP